MRSAGSALVFATFHGQESSCESTASAKGGAQFQNFMALYSSVDSIDFLLYLFLCRLGPGPMVISRPGPGKFG